MYSAFSAIYQVAVEQQKKLNIGKIDLVRYSWNMMWMLVIPPLFEELMVGRDDDDDDSLFFNNRWTRSLAGFSLGTMAGLREVAWVMESGRISELPVQRTILAPAALATQLRQFELDNGLIRAITAIPALFHIPGGSQASRTGQYLLALEQGDEEGFDVWEFLVTGPREDDESDKDRRDRENAL